VNISKPLPKIFIVILSGFILGILLFIGVYAAVTLIYFRTIAGDGRVILLWETATELDNAGFYVQRSNEQAGNYQRINPTIIPSRGDGLTGATYEYLDTTVVNGSTYWYRLESIDFNQQSQYYDPVFAIPGTNLTLTPGSNSQFTSTPNSNRNTPALTQSPIVTLTNPPGGIATSTFPQLNSTPYPGPIIPSSDATSINQTANLDNSSAGPSVVGTLIPFPSITIQFPPTSTSDVVVAAIAQEDSGVEILETSKPSLSRFWPLGLLVMIWIAVIAWFVISRRHLSGN